MARIATIDKKEELAPEFHNIYDAIAQSRGIVGGPFLALLHSPELAGRTAHLGSYGRFTSARAPSISLPRMRRSSVTFGNCCILIRRAKALFKHSTAG